MYGWSVSIAPFQKNVALLSSGEPANSSMLNGPAGASAAGVALEVGEAEAVEERGRLLHADDVVVERRVVVDVLRVADEAVVGDDGDVGVGRILQHLRQRGAVDRSDDQGFSALGDHVLDLRDLRGDVVLCVLQVDGEALVLELRLDGVAVLDPALGALRGHRDADEAAVAFAPAAAGVAGARGEREHGSGRERCEKHLLRVLQGVSFHCVIHGRRCLGDSRSRPRPCQPPPLAPSGDGSRKSHVELTVVRRASVAWP